MQWISTAMRDAARWAVDNELVCIFRRKNDKHILHHHRLVMNKAFILSYYLTPWIFQTVKLDIRSA